MSALWHATAGEGPDLVLLHGWGLHGECWGEALEVLQARFRVTRLDLPGHGRSATSEVAPTLDAWAAAALAVAPPRAHWLGWSLGGMVALAAALAAPTRVAKLVTVATTPRFLQAPGWPAAQAPAALERVMAGLATDYRRTVDDFLALQVLGSERAQATLRELKRRAAAIFDSAPGARGEPSAAALQGGLAILRDADLRADVPRLVPSLLAIMGRLDRLTPQAAGEWLAAHAPAGRALVMPRAAHAPFLSHPAEFNAAVAEFLA
jgi:pimeloyl-[acyl-carrier protein] methyl ester esterase